MNFKKRIFDLTLAISLSILLLPIFLILVVCILFKQGRPIFFASPRTGFGQQEFILWKFRTMHNDISDFGVSGGDKDQRITEIGRFLRQYRLDELPQLWNILIGNLSFVGPRPPDPHYANAFPDLYRKVLMSKPGVTGLATVKFYKREAQLLSKSNNPTETDRIYRRICIPRKAKLDLIYQKNQSLSLDLFIIFQTIHEVFLPSITNLTHLFGGFSPSKGTIRYRAK